MILKTILAILAALLVAAGGYFGKDISFETQWVLYEALRTTASIVFAVAGAWIAIIYPERLKAPFQNQSVNADESIKHYKALFSPIVNSIFVLCAVLLIGILAPILKQIPLLIEYKNICRSASYVLVTTLTLCQVWTVFITLFPASILHHEANKDVQRARIQNRY